MIITDEKALRVKCEDVKPEEIGELISLLERELQHSAKLGRAGIGLAGPQIGIAKNIAIVRIDNVFKANLVNAVIADKYDPMIFKDEGCLSFPDRYENTNRYQEIHVINNLDKPNSFISTGLMAVVIQHEIDHLHGILLPDIAIANNTKNLGPNDPCFCGEIDILTNRLKKYKKCHGKGI